MWGMWWWEFDKEEPLQEDLAVYERMTEMRRDRARMDRDKQKQKEAAAARRANSGGKQVSSASYNIPDPDQ